MNKIKLLLILTLFHFINISSQEKSIFIPREINKAIKSGTRTLNGIPGSNYWQNLIDYKIEVDFNPQTGKIKGNETIIYTNNSPSSMYMIVVNLYPNLFKKGNSRDREVNPEDVHDGIKINRINIDGFDLNPNMQRITYSGTHMNLILPKSLATKHKINIQLEWEFNMQANTTIRVGKYGSNTWFIGYWYPQIAVYDDLFGWDIIDYDGLHEFYSPFADFDVKITAPSNQIIWATGIWQNPEEILKDTYLSKYKQAINSEKVVNIVKADDLSRKITKSETSNVWHYTARNVPDFCFATSDQYLWDGVSVTTDKKENKKTFVQAAYKLSSSDFYEVADIGKETIQYLSTVMPAIPFPYPRMTIFNGDGGMEFPMMVNDRSEYSKSGTVNLTSHEISHTYFPFYMGINQERYSWMDEGWAQFLPAEFQDQKVRNNNQVSSSAFNYSFYAGTSLEMPMMVPSHFMKGYEYYIASYYRPELAFRVLQNLLGKDLFLKALQEYIHRWNGKYPSPYDFFFTFNDIAKQDLSWFWKPWFFEMAYPDLGIQSINKEKNEYIIDIENIGGLPLPVELIIEFNDGSKTNITKTAEIWKNGNKSYQISYKADKVISRCSMSSKWIPDTNYSNNQK